MLRRRRISAPARGSPLLYVGSNSLLPPVFQNFYGVATSEPIPFDQQGEGFPRVLYAGPSIGAVEGNRIAPPVLADIESASLVFTAGGSSVTVTQTLTVSGDESVLHGATVSVGNFAAGEDELAFVATDEIAGALDAATGVLIFSGVASLSDYEAVLRSVTYTNSSTDPDLVTRAISFQVDNGEPFDNLSNVVARDIEINRSPVAENDEIERYPGMPTKVRIADLLANNSDSDDDPVTLVAGSLGMLIGGAEGATFGGGSVEQVGDWIFYTPPEDGGPERDHFFYRIEDGRGGTASARVDVMTKSLDDGDVPMNPGRITATGDSQMHLVFTGIPWATYTIQYMDSRGGDREWCDLATATADEFGHYEWLDNLPDDVTARLYRAVLP